MTVTTTKPRPPKKAVPQKPVAKCDNHPDRDAAVTTTNNGAHQEISLCGACIPPSWR